MTKILLPVALVLLAVVGVVWYLLHRHDDCSFSGWKQTIGVDIEVATKDVDAIKGKVGITDEQTRQFDTLMTDFALKYDANCNDYRQGRMNQAEYLCRRNNMDKALDQLRVFVQKVEAAKAASDPAAQRDILLNALDDLEKSRKSEYRAGCTSAMLVDPLQIPFHGQTALQAVQVTNSGNNPLIFTVATLPIGFIAVPKTGQLAPGTLAAVIVYRTVEPVTSGLTYTFHIVSNFQDDISVQLTLDPQNASLYKTLGDEARSLAAASKPNANVVVTLADALTVVDQTVKKAGNAGPPQGLEAIRYLLAAGVLAESGSPVEAQHALDTAALKDPSLAKEPTTLVLRGVVANQQGDSNRAFQAFAEASRSTPREDSERKAVSDLYAGAVALKTDPKAAVDIFGKPDLVKSVQRDPGLVTLVGEQVGVPNLGKAMHEANPVFPDQMRQRYATAK